MALSNSQYEAIMRKYEVIRDHNRDLLRQRKNEVYEAVPEFRRLEEETASSSVRQARLLLSGDEDALSDLKNTLKQISARKTALLKEAGFPVDYLNEIYSCPHCLDTGYLTASDGTRTKCDCFRKQEIDILYSQSNIQNGFKDNTFSALSYDYYSGEDLEHFKGAVRICINFVQNFKQDYHNILFYGTVGTGKSFLSACIANELLQKGNFVLYFSASAFFDTLARYTFDDSGNRQNLADFCSDIYGCDLLIIDDLGTENTNSFVNSELFVCLNERHMRNHATIISTNLNLKELKERYSDRVLSRISSNFELCKLTGADIRIQKKLNNKATESEDSFHA